MSKSKVVFISEQEETAWNALVKMYEEEKIQRQAEEESLSSSGCPRCGSYEGDWHECPECGHGQ